MADLLDPWDDAALIAARLASPHRRLIVVVGAEAWCQKCRELKTHFEAVASKASSLDLLLWLDLEGHQEFLGDYIPEDLPEFLIYRQSQLLFRRTPEETDQQAITRLLSAESEKLDWPPMEDAPGIIKRLVEPNWAKNIDK